MENLIDARQLAAKRLQEDAAVAIKSETEALSELANENNSSWEQILAEDEGSAS